MSDPIYEILDHLRKEVQSLRVENDRLRRSRNDEIAAAGDLRKKIERLRARVEVLEGLAHQSLKVMQCSDDHSEHWCAHCDDNIGGSHIVALRAALEAKP